MQGELAFYSSGIQDTLGVCIIKKINIKQAQSSHWQVRTVLINN